MNKITYIEAAVILVCGFLIIGWTSPRDYRIVVSGLLWIFVILYLKLRSCSTAPTASPEGITCTCEAAFLHDTPVVAHEPNCALYGDNAKFIQDALLVETTMRVYRAAICQHLRGLGCTCWLQSDHRQLRYKQRSGRLWRLTHAPWCHVPQGMWAAAIIENLDFPKAAGK